MDKLITFAVPCYNSAAYMEHCVETLLQGGDDIEIILVDDGSTRDETPAICDRYQEQYPDIVRAIHQENGGHGEGVNCGLRNARGIYYKVVDSDDWVDVPALHQALDKLRQFTRDGKPIDMMICNSVNEKVMVSRVDQQLRVTYQMIDSHDLRQVSAEHKKLGRYMFNYLAMMMAISTIFLILANTPESLGKKTQLWEYLRTVDAGIYHKMKYRAVSAFTNFPGYQGRKLSVGLYRLARKIYKFN